MRQRKLKEVLVLLDRIPIGGTFTARSLVSVGTDRAYTPTVVEVGNYLKSLPGRVEKAGCTQCGDTKSTTVWRRIS